MWITYLVLDFPGYTERERKMMRLINPSRQGCTSRLLKPVTSTPSLICLKVPDFTRYAKSPKHQYVQLLIIPIGFTWIAFQGMVVASAGYVLYGGECEFSQPFSAFPPPFLSFIYIYIILAMNMILYTETLTLLCLYILHFRFVGSFEIDWEMG